MDGMRKKFADQHADTIQEVSELEKHNNKLERETNIYREQSQSSNSKNIYYRSISQHNLNLIKLAKSDDLRNQIDMLNKARTDEENLVAKLEDQEKLLKDQGQTMDIKLTAALSDVHADVHSV